MDKSIVVKQYILKHDRWLDGLTLLRSLLHNSELEEDVKWGMPTYTLKGKNVIGLAGFKHHYGLWFHQGCFLTDTAKILENAQKGKTKGMRHIKFDVNSVIDREMITAYIEEAIHNQREGKEIRADRRVKSALEIPDFMKSHVPERAIEILGTLSIGKRNEYIKYIENAKQMKTKLSRIVKITPLLLERKGLNDMYLKS